jgi:hypothetical protein
MDFYLINKPLTTALSCFIFGSLCILILTISRYIPIIWTVVHVLVLLVISPLFFLSLIIPHLDILNISLSLKPYKPFISPIIKSIILLSIFALGLSLLLFVLYLSNFVMNSIGINAEIAFYFIPVIYILILFYFFTYEMSRRAFMFLKLKGDLKKCGIIGVVACFVTVGFLILMGYLNIKGNIENYLSILFWFTIVGYFIGIEINKSRDNIILVEKENFPNIDTEPHNPDFKNN